MPNTRPRSWVSRRPSRTGPVALLAFGVAISLAVHVASASTGWVVSISRTSVVAGTSNTLVQTFTTGAAVNNGPALTTLIPLGWTAPQTKSAGGGGYVKTVAGTCSAAGTATVTGTGPWTVSITGVTCNVGQTLGVSYAKASATAAGPYTFGPLSQSGTDLADGLQVSVTPAATSRLSVLGYPTPTAAGTTHTFSVTAVDAYANTTPAYTGRVHVTSTDSKAALPADYTFTGADAGTHVFSATLNTVGSRALSATDTATKSINGSQSAISVVAGPTSTLVVAGYPSPVTAGSSRNFSVTARDVAGNTTTGYRGTVAFTSSDAQAVLPSPYTFTAPDAGARTFAATLKTAGNAQSITATDGTPVVGTQSGIVIRPAATRRLLVAGYPTPTDLGAAHTFTVTAVDTYGNTTPGYVGTVRFSSSDARATLPPQYPFVAADAGVHTFSAALNSAGTQALRATDAAVATTTGSQTGISINPGQLTITASDAVMSYGGDLPSVTPSYSGLVGPDSAPATLPTCVADPAVPSTRCSGADDPNYTIDYQDGALTFNSASVTVAVSGSQVYGGSPVFTPDYSSSVFAAGDDSSVVSGVLSCTTDATAASAVGSGYAVSDCSGLSASNYDIGYSYGLLAVTPVSVTVTAKDKTITQGDPDPTFDYEVSGLIGSDTLTGVTCGVTGSHSSPAEYPITCGGNTNTNYDADYEPGTLTVEVSGPGSVSCGTAGSLTAAATCTYSFTGASDSFTVPSDVYLVAIDAKGAQGGNSDHDSRAGALGGDAIGDVPVTPGAVLQVTVGGQGGSGAAGLAPVAGGFNGGGDSPGSWDGIYRFSWSGGGGGGSDVRAGGCAAISSCGLAQRVVVGGGGGGAGRVSTPAGAGGGLSGEAGGTAFTAGGGGGGTQTAGGAGGSGLTAGGNGTAGQGGVGALGSCCGVGGGGGGGGWFGGGGGGRNSSNGGGGGGGSGYGPVGTTFHNGVRAGNGQITISWTTTPVWTQTCSGYDYSAALRADGTLWAWGYNAYGELGDGTGTSRLSPVQIGSADNWKQVSCGFTHTVALRTDGTLWAWGQNSNGQLGDGTTTSQYAPEQIGVDNWRQVSAGQQCTLALRSDGTLWAWGFNFNGQLGDGTNTQRTTPVQIGSGTWTQVSAGGSSYGNFTAAIKSDGSLWSWGSNYYGQLGLGGTWEATYSPLQVGSAINWTEVASGAAATVARRTDGTLWGWGFNANGEVGDGTTTMRTAPVQIGTATTWTHVAAGYFDASATRSDGTLWSWGYNNHGQLGDGTTTTRTAPQQVGVSTNWLGTSMGYDATVGTASNGTMWGWGYNSTGQVGDGTTVQRSSPVQIGS